MISDVGAGGVQRGQIQQSSFVDKTIEEISASWPEVLAFEGGDEPCDAASSLVDYSGAPKIVKAKLKTHSDMSRTRTAVGADGK